MLSFTKIYLFISPEKINSRYLRYGSGVNNHILLRPSLLRQSSIMLVKLWQHAKQQLLVTNETKALA